MAYIGQTDLSFENGSKNTITVSGFIIERRWLWLNVVGPSCPADSSILAKLHMQDHQENNKDKSF
jgi:hypothetical protein